MQVLNVTVQAATGSAVAFLVLVVATGSEAQQLRIAREASELIKLQWDASIDRQYQVEQAAALPGWSPLGAPLFGPQDTLSVLLSPTDSGCVCYRLKSSDSFHVDLYGTNLNVNGTLWTYQATENDNGVVRSYTETQETIGTAMINGYLSLVFEERTNGVWNGEMYYEAEKTNGMFYVGGQDADGEVDYYNPPAAEYYAFFRPGVTVTQYCTNTVLGPTTQTVTQAVSPVAVTVPAGTYPVSIRVDECILGNYLGYEISGTGTTWYVQGIGGIKMYYEALIPDLGHSSIKEMELSSFTP